MQCQCRPGASEACKNGEKEKKICVIVFLKKHILMFFIEERTHPFRNSQGRKGIGKNDTNRQGNTEKNKKIIV